MQVSEFCDDEKEKGEANEEKRGRKHNSTSIISSTCTIFLMAGTMTISQHTQNANLLPLPNKPTTFYKLVCIYTKPDQEYSISVWYQWSIVFIQVYTSLM